MRCGPVLDWLWRFATDATPPKTLGDFTTSRRVLLISLIAVGVGIVATGVAYVLLELIRLFTNFFFFHTISVSEADLAHVHRGPLLLVIPVGGGLVVGCLARWGSERIRGHGIPEAIEAILVNGSRVEPRVAVMKPLASAIAIGSGGPFGAEGPIILTGGAVGSIVAQALRLSSMERRSLLVAGAAAGMSATFGAPLAATLLAAELLLFELKPRSLVPVAIASATAAVFRGYLLDPAPLFPVPAHSADLGPAGMGAAVLVGLSTGLLSMSLTAAVYASEDAFHRLPIHWMWWPAISGLAIGAGGLIFPRALGVGYPVIRELLSGNASLGVILGVVLVKSTIWSVSLGSGTSGGVLAPLLMIGCALGALEAPFLPDRGAGFWPLVAMGAALGATMRVPLTSVAFAFELTRDANAMLGVLVAVVVAYGFTVLVLRRSILTEKISRRGLHLGREYAVDPAELVLVSQVMATRIPTLPAEMTLDELARVTRETGGEPDHGLYPIVDADGCMTGAISGQHLRALLRITTPDASGQSLADLRGAGGPVVAYPNETVRTALDRMAETGRSRLPVVTPGERSVLVGMIDVDAVLTVRWHALQDEYRRERMLGRANSRNRTAGASGIPAQPHAANSWK